MALLSQLFPGLRDFRTPFASGVIWLLLGWLLAEPHVNQAHPHGIYGAIHSLADALKPLGLGFALALLAYLVGAVAEVVWAGPLQLLGVVGPGGLAAITSVISRRLDQLSDEETVVFSFCHSYTARAYIAERAGGESRHPDTDERELPGVEAMASTPQIAARITSYLHGDLVSAIREEIDVIATRLLGDKQPQFEIYDRLRSEAEFRIAIAAPVAGVVYVLCRAVMPIVLAAVIAALVACVFMLQARNRRRAAGNRIADFLLVGDVNAPSLDQLKVGAYTFETLKTGQVRVPRKTEPPQRRQPTPRRLRPPLPRRRPPSDSVEEPLLGVPLLARIATEFADAFGELRSTVAHPFVAAWRAVSIAAFPARDLLFNEGRVVRERARLRAQLRAGSPTAWVALGDAYRDSRYYKQAKYAYGQPRGNISAIERLMELDLELGLRRYVINGGVRVLPELVNLFVEQGRLDTARDICEKLVAGGSREANIPLGDVLRALGDRPGAEAAYRAAAAAGLYTALGRLGDMMRRQGRDEEAEQMLNTAVEHEAWSALLPLGDLRMKEGRQTEASKAYQEAADAKVPGARQRLEAHFPGAVAASSE